MAYPTVLAAYGVRRVRISRAAATPQNIRDVSSTFCQIQKGVKLERLDRHHCEEGWREVLVEDKHAGPAEIAAARIDFQDWLGSLSGRQRKIATTLAMGETTGKAARKFQVTPSRISQLRREFMESWSQFQGELRCCAEERPVGAAA